MRGTVTGLARVFNFLYIRFSPKKRKLISSLFTFERVTFRQRTENDYRQENIKRAWR